MARFALLYRNCHRRRRRRRCVIAIFPASGSLTQSFLPPSLAQSLALFRSLLTFYGGRFWEEMMASPQSPLPPPLSLGRSLEPGRLIRRRRRRRPSIAADGEISRTVAELLARLLQALTKSVSGNVAESEILCACVRARIDDISK